MSRTVVVVNPDRKFRTKVADHLGKPEHIVESERVSHAEAVLRELDVESGVLVIGPGVPSDEALRLAAEAQHFSPGVSVVMVAARLTASLLQAAMRAGVRDVLPSSFTAKQLREAVDRANVLYRQSAIARGDTVSEAQGKVITVFSSKGGSGKSVVASNLALLLAEQTGEEVALVDLDLESGDLAIMLQLTPERTFYDAAVNVGRLDAQALRHYLTPYRAGMSLLAAPMEPGLAEKISAESVHMIFAMLRETYAHIVVDGPSYFTEQMLSALDESDEVLLVASLDVPSVKSLKMSLRTLELLNFRRERIRIVLNRADSKVGLHVQEVEKALGTRIELMVPSSRDVPLCINRGVPVALEARKSGVTLALGRLAELVRAAPESPRRTTRRWLSRR